MCKEQASVSYQRHKSTNVHGGQSKDGRVVDDDPVLPRVEVFNNRYQGHKALTAHIRIVSSWPRAHLHGYMYNVRKSVLQFESPSKIIDLRSDA